MSISVCPTYITTLKHLNRDPHKQPVQIGYTENLRNTLSYYRKRGYKGVAYTCPSADPERDVKSLLRDFQTRHKHLPSRQFENEKGGSITLRGLVPCFKETSDTLNDGLVYCIIARP